MSSYKIAIAGTGYVGLSNAILLSQHNEVYAVDIIEEKVNLINSGKSPIVDKEIQEYLATKDLNLTSQKISSSPQNFYVRDVLFTIISILPDLLLVHH